MGTVTKPGTQVQTRRMTDMDMFRRDVEKMREQFSTVLPASVNPERFERVLVTSVRTNMELLKKDRSSLIGSCMMAAQLGLLTDPFLGQAYLVPFGGKVQLIVGYRGLMQLARQSSEIKSFEVDTIHENDEVTLIGGDESKFTVIANWRDRGKVIGVYAIARFKNGGLQRTVMNVAEVNQIRDASMGKNSLPWTKHWGEMAKKTALRRLCKMLPLSAEVSTAIAVEDAVDMGSSVVINQDGDVVTDDMPDTVIDGEVSQHDNPLDERMTNVTPDKPQAGITQEEGGINF